MDSDCSCYLTAAPKQATQEQMSLYRLIVQLHHSHENFQSLVRLLVKQVIQAPVIVSAKLSGIGLALPGVSKPRKRPARRRSDYEQGCQQYS